MSSPVPEALRTILNSWMDEVRNNLNRLIVPDEFMEAHPEREQMVIYLKARAWKGTESGAADVARIPLTKLEQWRKHPEFSAWEERADEACTDHVEEMALQMAYVAGDRHMVDRILKGRRGRVYGDRQEITGKGGGPIEILSTVPRPERPD